MWFSAQGCHGRSRFDGHTECLCHALCTKDFRHYDPAACPTCAVAVTALLGQPYLTGFEPRLQLVWQCWRNVQKLVCKHEVLATWTNPDLLFLLGLVHPSQVSQTPSVQVFLKDPARPEPSFSGFASSTHAAGASPLCTTTPRPSHPVPAALLSNPVEQPKRKKSCWGLSKKFPALSSFPFVTSSLPLLGNMMMSSPPAPPLLCLLLSA